MPRSRQFSKVRLLCRRERWVLTWQGWLLVGVGLTMSLVLSLTQLYPFLAVNRPIVADALVVEGWVTDADLRVAAEQFRTHTYSQLITTGGPIPTGTYLSEYKTFANLAALTLQKLGIAAHQITVVSAPYARKDRTYTSALALGRWLNQNHSKIHRINLLSAGPHAQRSWFLFRQALGPAYEVGILASSQGLDFNPHRWWASSAGFRTVTSEAIAYLYTRVFNILD